MHPSQITKFRDEETITNVLTGDILRVILTPRDNFRLQDGTEVYALQIIKSRNPVDYRKKIIVPRSEVENGDLYTVFVDERRSAGQLNPCGEIELTKSNKTFIGGSSLNAQPTQSSSILGDVVDVVADVAGSALEVSGKAVCAVGEGIGCVANGVGSVIGGIAEGIGSIDL
jgi:hypothetical protein